METSLIPARAATRPQTFGKPTKWPDLELPGNTKSKSFASRGRKLPKNLSVARPIGRICAPDLVSLNRRHRAWRSTVSHCRVSASIRRQPVSNRKRIARRPVMSSASASISRKATPGLHRVERERRSFNLVLGARGLFDIPSRVGENGFVTDRSLQDGAEHPISSGGSTGPTRRLAAAWPLSFRDL